MAVSSPEFLLSVLLLTMPLCEVHLDFWTALGIARSIPLLLQEEVAVWPCSVTVLLEFTSFLATLHWRQGAADLRKFGISYFELLDMVENSILVTSYV